MTGPAAPRLADTAAPGQPRLPTRLLRAVGVLRPTAVENAREALSDLHIALTDRDLLAPADGHAPAGELVALDRAECLRLLGRRSLGRLAYIARAGVPDVVPVNYAMDGDDVVLRSGPGPKLQAAERGDTVAFEVDAIDELTRTGWSVVVIGQARRVGAAEVEGEPEPWADGPRRHLVRIAPVRITGRRITG